MTSATYPCSFETHMFHNR